MNRHACLTKPLQAIGPALTARCPHCGEPVLLTIVADALTPQREVNEPKPANSGAERLPELPHVLTIAEAAQVLRRSGNYVYEMCRQNRIRHIREGSRVFIPREAVEEYLRTSSDGRPKSA